MTNSLCTCSNVVCLSIPHAGDCATQRTPFGQAIYELVKLGRVIALAAACLTAFSVLTACAGTHTYLDLEWSLVGWLMALIPQYPEAFAVLVIGGIVIHMNHDRWTMPVEAPPPPAPPPTVYHRYDEPEPYGNATFANPYEAHVAIGKKDPRLNLPKFED